MILPLLPVRGDLENTEYEYVELFFFKTVCRKRRPFEGLSIWEEEKYRELQGTYPVIFISFADVKQNNYEDAVQKIKNIIVDVYRQHRYLEQQSAFLKARSRIYCLSRKK